jgi:hypothetical protein
MCSAPVGASALCGVPVAPVAPDAPDAPVARLSGARISDVDVFVIDWSVSRLVFVSLSIPLVSLEMPVALETVRLS